MDPAKRSSFHARIARSCDARPKRSVSSRVMPHFSAMRSAPSNCDVISYRPKYDFGIGRPYSPRLSAPIGTRLMTSTPQATATSTTPDPTSDVAKFVACCEEPHCVSIVVAATDSGRPAVSQAVRPMLKPCSPTLLTHPVTTCPTSRGSTPERSTSADCAVASRSAGWTLERPPPRRPTGVRTASTITTSVMGPSVPVTICGDPSRRPLRARGGGARRRRSSRSTTRR